MKNIPVIDGGPRMSAFRPMRRAKQALDDEEIREVLRTARRGVLAATGDGGRPCCVTLNLLSGGKHLFSFQGSDANRSAGHMDGLKILVPVHDPESGIKRARDDDTIMSECELTVN